VSIGGTTYTFENSITGASAPNTVKIGVDVQSTLANLAGAIGASVTGGQAPGTTYGSGTVANAQVSVTSSTATTLNLQAAQSGATGNSIATSTNWDSTAGITSSFGTADLAGGTDAGTFGNSIPVFDSLGNSHTLSFTFTKSTAGAWNYQITIPAADVGKTGTPQVVANGTLQFDSSGNLVSPSADVTGISVPGLTDGAKTMNINWHLFSSPGTAVITQTAEPSATSGKSQNGYSAGTLQTYSIDTSGIINGVLSNGQTVSLAQIALATFPNYNGLSHAGPNDYQATLASGAPSVGAPGTGGSGTLDGGSLEASNVDIATAFTQLIQAERGYQANAKAITTADDLMQSSIALIQG
jgi:flagellar hook protein FlgE